MQRWLPMRTSLRSVPQLTCLAAISGNFAHRLGRSSFCDCSHMSSLFSFPRTALPSPLPHHLMTLSFTKASWLPSISPSGGNLVEFNCYLKSLRLPSSGFPTPSLPTPHATLLNILGPRSSHTMSRIDTNILHYLFLAVIIPPDKLNCKSTTPNTTTITTNIIHANLAGTNVL